MKIKITKKEVSNWNIDLKNGLILSEIAKKYNRRWATINRILREEDNETWRLMSKSERKELQELYKSGLSVQKIVKLKCLTFHTVYRILKKTTFNIRKKKIVNFTRVVNNFSDFDIGYLVGIIDGEGYLGMIQEKERLRPRLVISNCDKKIIDYILKILPDGRKKICSRSRLDKPNWTKLYTYWLSDKKLLQVLLEKLAPYMIGKKEEVELMLNSFNCNDKIKAHSIYKKFQEVKYIKNSKVKLIK